MIWSIHLFTLLLKSPVYPFILPQKRPLPQGRPLFWGRIEKNVQTLQRVDGEDKCSLTELVRRKGMPPRVGMLNIPTLNGELRRATASYVDSVDGSQPKMN